MNACRLNATLIAALVVVAGTLVAPRSASAQSSVQNRQEVGSAFDIAMRGWLERRGIEHASIAVMREDRLVFAKGFGDRDANQRIGVWSLSKAITAVCVATLAQEGRLSFDSPIGPLLAPIYEKYGRPADTRVEDITVGQLVGHRGGYPRVVGGNRFAPGIAESLRLRQPAETTVVDLLPHIQRLQLAREPGSVYEYSNVGYLLLGQVIEAVSGRNYEKECNERVLSRAGIKAATLEPIWGRLAHASAGWSLSGPEYLAFARLLRARQLSVLKTEMHAWLRRPEGHWTDDGQRLRAYTLGMQLYVVPNARPNLFHGGSWDWIQSDAKGGPIDEINWTYFVMAADGTAWFASLAGKRGDSEREIFNDLDKVLWRAKEETTSWTSRDLFPSMGVGPIVRRR